MAILQETSPVQTLGGAELELNLANELRVPKREVMADVTFLYAADRPQPCLFYLSFYSPRRSGEESLCEYLNSMHSFFPLRDKASGEFFIVHVNQVMYVREAPLVEMIGTRSLCLHLQNGTKLQLYTCEPRHAWRSRPIDLLNNDAERFVAFSGDNHARIHVNKRHIARVEGL
ncbi:MAG: hypothetical protein L6428_03825 [Candidatus Aminicenantes bacterium]|nr:hypothetical protein [Candidatus Aminicenantes bacterium]